MLNTVKMLSLNISRRLCRTNLKLRAYSSSTRADDQKADDAENVNDEPLVLVEKDSHITLIGINREKTRNSINLSTAERLSEAFDNFESDSTSPVAVLYGVGGSFSSGYDLKELHDQLEKGSTEFLLRHEGSVGPTRRHLQKPVVCAISGFCVASGLELALMCDLRVMEDTAVLGFFNRRFGVPMRDGGTVRLAKLIGFSRACDIIESGRKVSAQEALNIGLINRLVATGTSLGQAVNLAISIAKYAQNSLLHDRKSLQKNTYEKRGLTTAIQNEIMLTSKDILEEIKEGAQRFKSSELKGARTFAYEIKEKPLPEWEKAEIEIEEEVLKKRKALKADAASKVK